MWCWRVIATTYGGHVANLPETIAPLARRNYLASIQQLHYELDEMGCEVLAVSADGREKAEGFVSAALLAFYHTPPQHDAMSCMPPA